jgi:hypothetical protein
VDTYVVLKASRWDLSKVWTPCVGFQILANSCQPWYKVNHQNKEMRIFFSRIVPSFGFRIFFAWLHVERFWRGFGKLNSSLISARDEDYIPELSSLRLNTYMHVCIHTYIHTYIHIYIQTERLSFKRLPWRSGIVIIASAHRTEDPGLESRQGVRFLGRYTFQCCCQNLVCIVGSCVFLRKILPEKENKFCFRSISIPFILADFYHC